MQASSSTTRISCWDKSYAYQIRAFGPLWDERYRRIRALLTPETAAGDRIAARLINCCAHPHIVTYADGLHYHLTEQRCRSRVCPRCARMRARALAIRIATLVRRMETPRFLTLTIRSNDRPLREQVNQIRRRFAAMRRSLSWKTHVIGGVYTIEITHNRSTGQWHPHLHAIIDGDYYPHSEILVAWQTVVRDQAGVDIRAVRGVRKLANYLTAYVAKSCNLADLDPNRLSEWAIETHALRLAQTFGSLQACKPQTTAADELDPLPIRHVDINVHALAYAAARGSPLCERLLRMLEPTPRPKPPEDPAAILALIHRYNYPHQLPHGPDPPEPRDREADQQRMFER